MPRKTTKTKAKTKAKKAPSKMDIAKAAIKKKYGDVVKPMSDKPLIIDTISTRSIGLDTALGRGGLALGRIYEIYGPNSAGKTTLAMSVIAEAQSRGMNAAFVDAEHSADPNLFKSMGVDLDKLEVIDNFTGEDNLDAAETLMKTGELQLLVVDSVTSLIPKVQAEKEIGDTNIALLARLMSNTLLRYVPIAARNNVCVIFINQIRHKIGVMMGNPETTSGGLSLGFYATGRIRVSGVGAKDNMITDANGVTIGHTTIMDVKKNKLNTPFTRAKVDLIYGVGYDMVGELISLATDLAIIEKSGSWYSYEGNSIGQGKAAVRQFFEDNHDVFLVIKDAVTEVTGLKEFYDAQEERDRRVAENV